MEYPKLTSKKIERPEIDPGVIDDLTSVMQTVIDADPQPLYGDKEAEGDEVENGRFRRFDLETAPPDSMSITVASYLPHRRVHMAERVRQETAVDIDAPLGHVAFQGIIGNSRIGGAIYVAETTAVAWVEFSILNPFGRPADDNYGSFKFAEAMGVTDLWARFTCDRSRPAASAHTAGIDDLAIMRLTRTVSSFSPLEP